MVSFVCLTMLLVVGFLLAIWIEHGPKHHRRAHKEVNNLRVLYKNDLQNLPKAEEYWIWSDGFRFIVTFSIDNARLTGDIPSIYVGKDDLTIVRYIRVTYLE